MVDLEDVENHNLELQDVELGAHLGVVVDHRHEDEDDGLLAEVTGPQDVEKHEVQNGLNVVKKLHHLELGAMMRI